MMEASQADRFPTFIELKALLRDILYETSGLGDASMRYQSMIGDNTRQFVVSSPTLYVRGWVRDKKLYGNINIEYPEWRITGQIDANGNCFKDWAYVEVYRKPPANPRCMLEHNPPISIGRKHILCMMPGDIAEVRYALLDVYRGVENARVPEHWPFSRVTIDFKPYGGGDPIVKVDKKRAKLSNINGPYSPPSYHTSSKIVFDAEWVRQMGSFMVYPMRRQIPPSDPW